MKNLGFAATAIVSLLTITACTDDDVVSDELAGPDEAEPADGKADISDAGVHTYFSIASDFRKCAFPMCGGFFLDRLNASKTKCHDGSSSERCYTPELDISESGLSDADLDKLRSAASQPGDGVQAIVRGRFAKKNLTTPQPTLGRFIVTEVWLSQSDAVASGVFAKINDNGLRCIVAPCPSLREKALNTSRKANISDVDFSESGLDADQAAEAMIDSFESHGLIVAGDRYNFKIDGRKGKGRTATAVYRRMKAAPAAAECFVGGCSSHICSDQEGVISTCEFRPEYACYQTASCERQPDGECGWTPTAELQTCLGETCCDPAQNPGGIEGAHCCADGSWQGDIGNGGSDECVPFGGDGQVCSSAN